MMQNGEYRWYGVFSDSIDSIWPEVAPLLQRAIDYADGKYSSEDIKGYLKNRDMQLWVVYSDKGLETICITQLIFYPQSKRMTILFLSSEDFKEALPFWQLMTEFAKDKGCAEIEIFGRPGWERKLQHLGFKKIHTVLKTSI